MGLLLFGLRSLFLSGPRYSYAPPGFRPYLLFWIYGGIAIFTAALPYAARVEWLRIGSFLGAYWGWTELFTRYKRRRLVLGLLLVLVSILCWYGIIQSIRESQSVLFLERDAMYRARISSTYINPNLFANLLVIFFSVALAFAFSTGSGHVIRILSIYLLFILVPTLVLTMSRGAWAGAIFGGSLTTLLLSWKQRRRMFWPIALTLVAGIAITGLLLWQYVPAFQARLLQITPDRRYASSMMRLLWWKEAWKMFLMSPVLGHGPGSFRWILQATREFSYQVVPNFAHNEYLHLLAEYGTVGFVLFAAFAGSLIRGLWRCFARATRSRDLALLCAAMGSAAGYMVHGFFDIGFHLVANAHLLILVLGMTWSCLYASGELHAEEASGRNDRVWWLGGTIAVGVMLCLSAQVWAGQHFHRAGVKARNNGDYEKALSLYARSARVDPSYWRASLSEATTHLRRAVWIVDPEVKSRYVDKAIHAYERARVLNPLDMRVVYGLGRAHAAKGDNETALTYIREASETWQKHQYYQVRLGLFLRERGYYEEALKQFEEAKYLLPNFGQMRSGKNKKLIRSNVQWLRKELKKQQKRSRARPENHEPAPHHQPSSP